MIDNKTRRLLQIVRRSSLVFALGGAALATASAAVDGTYNAADGYTNVTPLHFQLDNGTMVKDPGTLAWRVDGSGNVFVAYVQPLSINDNTYGTNAIGWDKGHKFGDLTGSDKAHFDFTNGAGQLVLSFDLDYISQVKVGTATTFQSLGVTGGDGKILTGSASSVTQWATSLGYDLNTLGYSQYTTNSPAATAQLDSKGNIDYSKPYLNSAAPGWDYSITYEVMISKDAFGAAGFGSVSVPYAHDSPSKFGQNTIPVVPVPEPSTYVAAFVFVALLGASQARKFLRKQTA